MSHYGGCFVIQHRGTSKVLNSRMVIGRKRNSRIYQTSVCYSLEDCSLHSDKNFGKSFKAKDNIFFSLDIHSIHGKDTIKSKL